jgi:1-pyrroline-5-carboxylate dehydrogenase
MDGESCNSAASRAYIFHSLWEPAKNHLKAMLSEARTEGEMDFKNVINSVIDETSYNRIMAYIDLARKSSEAEIISGGRGK